MSTQRILDYRINLLGIKQRLLELAEHAITLDIRQACMETIHTINEALEALEQAQEEN